jgi:malonyl CoA-acyl carrier protein transacylase
MRLLLATRNAHKVREFARLLPGFDIDPLPDDVELPPEDGLTFAANALPKARAAAAATDVVIANDNGPTQLVVAGPDQALDAATVAAKERGVRAMRLAVRGAFHSPLVAAAVEPFRAALDEVPFTAPTVPVFASSTAAPFAGDGPAIRDRLARALVRPVRWREALVALHRLGVRTFVEVGPGKVLTGMVRRAFDDVEATTLEATLAEVAHG